MTNPPSTDRDPALVRFGSEVREARERAGKRQGEFAAEIGISRQHLTNVETGRRRAAPAIYWRIANALGLDAAAVARQEDVA